MLAFEPVDPTDTDDDIPDDAYGGCQCPTPDNQYLMEVDCGSVNFVHAACGKQPGDWADESFHMPPVPVTLHWHVSRDYWTNEVDAYGDITINGLSTPKES